MEFYYSEEKNVQIIIALLKANKIKKAKNFGRRMKGRPSC